MPKLIIKKDQTIIKKLSVPEHVEAFTVGCEKGNDIIIIDEAISFFHLQFEKQNGKYYVRDLQSQWGTFVNGKKISNKTEVTHKDEVKLGEHKILFLDSALLTSEHPVKSEQIQLKEPVQKKGKVKAKINEHKSAVPSLDRLNTWTNEDTNNMIKDDALIIQDTKHQNEQSTLFSESFKNSSDASSGSEAVPNGINGNQLYEKATPVDINETPAEYHITDATTTNNYITSSSDFSSDSIIGANDEQSYTPTSDNSSTDNDQNNTNGTDKQNYYLLGIYGYYLGRKFKMKQPETRIGRDRKLNDILIKKNSDGKIDQSVSRRHATLKFNNNEWYLSDKRSKSRTWLNNRKLEINEEVLIKPGDEIEIKSDKKSHILRIVQEENWDYSFPKKAGNWHIRNGMKIINTTSVAVLLIAALVFINSFKNKNYLTGKPDNLAITETIWASGNADSHFNDSEQSRISIYPAIADVNNDAFLDLVYVNTEGFINCINGKSKELLWVNTDFKAVTEFPITLDDIFNKGTPDIIIVSKDERVRVIDSKWGLEIWKSPILAGPLTGAPAIGDLNGDGLKDIAVASSQNRVYIGYSSLKSFRWVEVEIHEQMLAVISTGDITGDGLDKIFVGTENGKIIIIDGLSQRIMNELNVNEELSKASGRLDQNNRIRHPAAIADLNGDLCKDLVISTLQDNIIALSGLNLNRFWYDLSETQNERVTSSNQSISLGDLDGDELPDIISLRQDGKLSAMKGWGQGKDRIMRLWEYPTQGQEQFIGHPILADFNKNGTMDVLAATRTGSIYIFEGSTGYKLIQYNSGNAKLKSQPVIGCFDNENYLDVLILKDDGKFYKLGTNCPALEKTAIWGQAYGNSQHTNTSVYQKKNVKTYYVNMGSSLVIMVLIIGINFYFRNARKKLSYY